MINPLINPTINMLNTEIIGFLAASLTTVAFIPQAFKALRHRDTRSLSLWMYVIFTAGVVLWGIYGWLRGDWVIVTANAVTGGLTGWLRSEAGDLRAKEASPTIRPYPFLALRG